MQTRLNTDPAQPDELRNYVLRKLRYQADPNDIIYEICQQTGWDWRRSKAYIEQVESEHRPDLSVWQGWLYLIIGGVTAMAGLVLLGSVLLALFGSQPSMQFLYRLPVISSLVEEMDLTSGAPIRLVIYGGVSGLGMTIGGGAGIAQALKKIMI